MYVRTYVRHIRLSKWKLRVLLYKKRAGVFLVIFFLLLPWMEKSHLVLARTFFFVGNLRTLLLYYVVSLLFLTLFGVSKKTNELKWQIGKKERGRLLERASSSFSYTWHFFLARWMNFRHIRRWSCFIAKKKTKTERKRDNLLSTLFLHNSQSCFHFCALLLIVVAGTKTYFFPPFVFLFLLRHFFPAASFVTRGKNWEKNLKKPEKRSNFLRREQGRMEWIFELLLLLLLLLFERRPYRV